MNQLEIAERDAIVFLALLSKAHEQFDFQFPHPDGELTHAYGLNIFAAIIDNGDGRLLASDRNKIHSFNNPMMHAEQVTLKRAIDVVNAKRPRNTSTTSIENYYRRYLFNNPTNGDYWTVGGTLYTTLEPCPFCASALLVTRMKRIVFLIPDKKFGTAYQKLKTDYYSSYDTKYEQLTILPHPESELTKRASAIHIELLKKVEEIKTAKPTLYDTLLLDLMPDILKKGSELFRAFDEGSIVSNNATNKATLKDLLSAK
ncbi:MAG TPA: nucleoside deaminase [Chryseolinea sp.]